MKTSFLDQVQMKIIKEALGPPLYNPFRNG